MQLQKLFIKLIKELRSGKCKVSSDSSMKKHGL